MNRDKYLSKVEILLKDINEVDRAEAIEFYRNYFDDAGIENEENIIKTLGTPEALASTIRDSLNGGFDENIEIGDTGIRNNDYEEKNEVQEVKKKRFIDNGDKVIFLILLIAFFIPLTSFLSSVSGIIGILFSVVMFFFGFWIASFIFYVLGGVSIGIGVLYILSSLGASLILIGLGLIMIVLGEVIGKVASWFFKSCLPYLYSKVKNLFYHFTNRGVEA